MLAKHFAHILIPLVTTFTLQGAVTANTINQSKPGDHELREADQLRTEPGANRQAGRFSGARHRIRLVLVARGSGDSTTVWQSQARLTSC
jgi:hypothetical protein